MKKWLTLLLVVGTIAVAQDTISVAPPVQANKYSTTEAFVVGKDFQSRRCPFEYNVYIRINGKKPEDKNLYYVLPKSVLIPQGDISYTIFCIKG